MTTSNTAQIHHRAPQMKAVRKQQLDGACCEGAATTTNNKSHQGDFQQATVKILTNFSIDSIIGQDNEQINDSPRGNDHQQQAPVPIASSALPDSEFKVALGINNDLVQVKTNNATRGDHLQTHSQSGRHRAHEARKYRPKNFQCPVCGMAFSNNGQLKNHVRIHTGERPFRCNQSNCGKTFTRNEELTRHKLIHTGVRPHPCPSCPKSFGRKDHLKKHVKTHDRKKLRKSCYGSPPTGGPCPRLTKRQYDSDEATHDNPKMLLSPKKEQISNTNEQSSSNHQLNDIPMTRLSGLMTIPAQASSGVHYDQYRDSISLMPPPLPPVTFAPTPQFIDSSTARTMAAIASSTSLNMLSTTTSGSLQQLAGDYWQKWYNFLGFYQQP